MLANDTDVDGPGLTAILVSAPSNGTLVLSANGSFTYTPNANFCGTDSFVYMATDGSLNSGNATVTLTIDCVNNADANIVIVKQTNPGGDPTLFEFDPSYGNNFFLADGESNDSGELDPGTYSVSEIVPAGWMQGTVVCSDGSSPGNISLQAGETVTCVFNNVQLPTNVLTSTEFCPLVDNKLQLNYQLQSTKYLLNSSNPGQFYYNVFYTGIPGATATLSIQVPYPFITQGSTPIQAHNGVSDTNGDGCFEPSQMLAGYAVTTQALFPESSSGNQIITFENYNPSPNTINELTTVTVTGVVPATGLLYVTIHLDYGLKGTAGWMKSGTTAMGTGAFAGVNILSLQPYRFSFMGTDNAAGALAGASTPMSMNVFKKNGDWSLGTAALPPRYLGLTAPTSKQNPSSGVPSSIAPVGNSHVGIVDAAIASMTDPSPLSPTKVLPAFRLQTNELDLAFESSRAAKRDRSLTVFDEIFAWFDAA